MRGMMTTLAERFVLLVPVTSPPGTRRVMKLSYEQPLEVPPVVTLRLRDLRWGLLRRQSAGALRMIFPRAASTFGLAAASFTAQTRAVFGPESYHVEISAPDELLIEYARLERTAIVRSLLTARATERRTLVTEDFRTERAHLYESLYTQELDSTPPSANDETTTISTILVDFFIRPSFLRPPLAIGVVTSAMLAVGMVLHFSGVHRSGDVTALIVVLPALFAAYLVPGEHRLVRRMIRGVRGLVFALSVLSFAAAGTLTIGLSTSTRVVVWSVLLGLAAACTGLIGAAQVISSRKSSRTPEGGVDS
jgi:hypothetical protein